MRDMPWLILNEHSANLNGGDMAIPPRKIVCLGRSPKSFSNILAPSENPIATLGTPG